MMRKVLLMLFVLMSFNAFSQLQVKEGSFKREGSAVIDDKDEHYDDNERPMALIKISTVNINEAERKRINFRSNRATQIVKKYLNGQVWLYISKVADFLEISHPDYSLITYQLPETLCGLCTYEMTLEYVEPKPGTGFLAISSEPSDADVYVDGKHYGKTTTVVTDLAEGNHTFKLEKQGYLTVTKNIVITKGETLKLNETMQTVSSQRTYLIVKADQPDARIYIDNNLKNTGEHAESVIIGSTHTYKIECNLYHTETGTVTVNERMTIEKKLRPAFGYINVSTTPEQGAKVFVNGEYLGLSPIKSDKLKSGSHTVMVMKDMFKMTEKSFVVNDGQTTNATLNMSSNFVNVTINTDADADIYVDEEYKAKGRWTGRLSDGLHNFEARKQNHRSTKKSLDLVLGENKTIALEAPQPISGSVDVNSSPMSAEIYIDGKHYGQTPNYINEILIGTHELKLEKQGCTTITKTISIKEGETLIVNEMLQTAKEMSISTDKSGDKIYVDDKYVGLSPVTTSLAFGSHNVKAERNGKTVSKTVSVSQNSSNNIVKLLFGKEVTIESEQNGDAVYIDGKRVGTTSFKTYLTYGTYTVKLSRGTQSITENIEVSEYGPSTFKMEIGQTIQINSTKKGDKVFVDGKKVGNTPLQLNLSLGEHSVLVKRGKKTDMEYIYLKGELNQKYNFYPSRDYPFWSAVGGAFSDVGYFFGGVFEDMGYFFGNMFEGCYFSVNGGIKSFTDSDKEYFSYGLDFGGFFIDEFGIFASTSKWQYSWSILGGLNFDMSIFGVEYEGVIGRIGAGYTFSLSPDNYVQGVEYLAGVAIGEEGVFFNCDLLTTNFETFEMRVGLGWRW